MLRKSLSKSRTRQPRGKDLLISITLKGKALLALVEAGILQPTEEGGIEIDRFNRFWKKFEKSLIEWKEERLQQGSESDN